MLATFDNAMLPAKKWAHIIQEAVRYKDKEGGAEDANDLNNDSSTIESDVDEEVDEEEIDFQWDTPIEGGEAD
jgi:hypothetical protein